MRRALALTVCVMISMGASAATIVVDASGGGDYSDLQTAIDNAAAGDLIQVLAGTYLVDQTIVIDRGVTISGPIGGGASFQGTNTNALSVIEIASSSVTLQGLDITWTHVLENGYASPETADSLIRVMGSGLSGIQVQNNVIHTPLQPGEMKTWGARAITVDSNSTTGITIDGNTVYNTRNGIVVRYGNVAAITDNVVYNTKGGIMNYTSSQADADNRTMSGNSWSTVHNEWDIVWNSASYDPDYVASVLAVSAANGEGYVLDRRDAAGGHAVGNRSHVFVNAATGLNKVHEAIGSMNEPFATIALGLDAVIADGTLYIDIGMYQEQVIVGKDLEIAGAGAGATVVAPTTPAKYRIAESGSTTWEPVIFLFGGTDDGSGNISGATIANIDIHDLTVDGTGRVPTDRSAGMLLRNIAGTIANNTVQNMNIDGKETFGIIVYGDSDVTIDGNTVSGFSRGGIGIMSGTAVVSSNIVLGPGLGAPVTWAPNGIQIGYGASGTISGNEISGCGWPGSEWAGTALMVVDTSGVLVQGNYVHDNETGIGVTDFPEAAYGPSWAGAVSNVVVEGNTLEANEWALDICNEAIGITVQYNVFSNSVYDAIDVWSYHYYWPSYGIPFPSDVEIHYNSITGSGQQGLSVMDGIGAPVDATLNWWGDNDGPSGEGTGSGDSVSTNVIFSPWLGIDPDENAGVAGVQLVSPMLFVVDDIGLPPLGGYLDAAIAAANDLSGTDTIEVRHGTYATDEPITDAVSIVSQSGSAAHTTLNGDIALGVPSVLLGRLRQGFTINGSVTVGTGIDASTIHINWNDIYGIVVNDGDNMLDATFNYWGEDGPDTVGQVAIFPILPEVSDAIIAYMDAHGLSALDAIDYSLLLGFYLSGREALVAVDLQNAFGFDYAEAAELIEIYGAAAVNRALMLSGGDYDTFLVQLVGYGVGESAGGGGGAEEMPLHVVGDLIPLSLQLVHPVTGEVVEDALVSYSVCRTLEDGTPEIVAFGVMTYDGELASYTFDLDTAGWEPGIYDVFLGSDDGRSLQYQIEIAE